jgi:hypothetical protein
MLDETGNEKIAKRLERLANAITQAAKAMRMQSEFHKGDACLFGLSDLGTAENIVRQRIGRARQGGVSTLKAVHVTSLMEGLRAAHICILAVKEAGDEAWPDLVSAYQAIIVELQQAVQEEDGILSPEGKLSPDLPSVPFFPNSDWKQLREDERAYGSIHHGVALSAKDLEGTDHWTWSVGGVGLGITNSPLAAAQAAEDDYHAIFETNRLQ